MKRSLVRQIFRSRRGCFRRLKREPSRGRRRQVAATSAGMPLRLQELEPRIALSVNTGNARPYWGNGHYYAYTGEDIEWVDARDNAQGTTLSQLGSKGYLATITSGGENEFIYKYSNNGGNISKTAHTGGTDEKDTSEGRWHWRAPNSGDDGVVFRNNGSTPSGVYANWKSGQPDNHKNQDYLGIRTDGLWDDVDHDNDIQAYITEWGREGVEFTASFADLGSSDTVNGTENGTAAKMTVKFDRKVPSDYVDIRNNNNTPLIDIPITFSGTATAGTDYEMSVSGGDSTFRDGKLYVRNTQTVTLTFTPKNNTSWSGPRTIKATLGSDGDENIFGVGSTSTSQVWIFDDEPLLSLGQGAYQFIRAPFTSGSSSTLPSSNSSFNTSADTLVFDTDGIDETNSSLSDDGFYDSFAMRWETYVRIPATGSYTFRTSSDDGHALTVRRSNKDGSTLGSLSNWSDGSKTGATSAISLTKGDVVWVRYDMYEKSGDASARLLWDRPDGSGGTTTNQVIPSSAMFLSESLARGVDRTESASEDSTALGFQIFASKEYGSELSVQLTSTSETSNSTVNKSKAKRRTGSTQVGDDYAILSGSSQITTSTIGLNGTYGTLSWKPDKSAGSMENVQSFDFKVLTDSYAESAETITLTLGSNTGYGVSNSSQSVTISDSPFVLSVTAGQNPQEGGSDEDDLGWFTVKTNDRKAPAGLRLRYKITGGTASRDVDYTAPQATLSTASYSAVDLVSFPVGATETKIFIAALADAIREGDETVTLELVTSVETDDSGFEFQRYNVDSSKSQATLTIDDSELYSAGIVSSPADRIGTGTVRAQLRDGEQEAEFDVRLSSQPRSSVTVSLSTTSGTLSATSLSFTAETWNQPQRVTVSGQRTDQAATVSLSGSSSDGFYAGTSTQQRLVPSSWPTELELNLWEGGTAVPSQPTASVQPVDGDEGSSSRFGFDLSLGSPVVGTPVELLYAVNAGTGFALDGSAADVRHEPDRAYRPLVISNTTGSSGGRGFASLGSLTTVSSEGEFSAQAWVRLDRDTDGTKGVLNFSNSGVDGILLGFRYNKPALEIRDSSGTLITQILGDSVVALSEWNHLACSVDAANVASLYLNGELVGRQQLAQQLSRSTRTHNHVGRSFPGDAPAYLSGAVRGVAVWNAARTQEEIQASMLAATAGGDGLISALPLNDSLANTVSGAPAATLTSGSVNTAAFATTPIYAMVVPVGAYRVGVPLVVLDDLTAEEDETVTVSLVDSGLYSLGGSSSTATAELADDDTAEVEFLAAWSNLDGTSTGWTETSQFRVSEGDAAESVGTRLGLRLTSRPTADVLLRVKSSSGTLGDILITGPGGTTGSDVVLTFTSDTWDQVQEVRLEGIDDASIDGDIERFLEFTVESSDTAYAELSPGVSVIVLDDDVLTTTDGLTAGQNASAPMATISAPTRGTIAEDGSESAVFTVSLSSPATRDTLVFFDLEQSNRQLYAGDVSVVAGDNAQALGGLTRFEKSDAVDLRINFQSGGAETPSGYLADSGDVFGTRGDGWRYGWSSDHTGLGRDHGINSDQRLDTHVHFDAGATWEIALPDGVYEVTASIGDAKFGSTHTLNVEGVSYFSALALSANTFSRTTATVTVSDGRLTLDMGSAERKKTRINYVEIKTAGGDGTEATETASVDTDGIDETAETFAANGQTGSFATTWSGYIAIPETGSYTFSVPVQGGVRLTLDGETVIDQMIDTVATWTTDTLQLTRGDFVAVTLDYKSLGTADPRVALEWERPEDNNATSRSQSVPAAALSRVDGVHLLIAEGSSSATVTISGIDDSIEENDESLVVRMLSARGVEVVVKSQTAASDDSTQLELALGTTDRETVTLAAGTVLSLGEPSDETGSTSATIAEFTLTADLTLHRDRTAAAAGTLAWIDVSQQTTLGGSVVDLVASTDSDLYQVLDRSVTLTLASALTADSASGTGRFLASLTLESTNRGRVTLAAGTELVYRTESGDETATLVLVDSLSIERGATVASVAVTAKVVTRGLDLTASDSPLVGLGSRVDLPTDAKVTIVDDDTAGLLFFLDADGTQAADGFQATLVEQGASVTRSVRLATQPNDSVTVYLETDDATEARLQIPGEESAANRISLTFTPETWNTPQAFRIVPVDDRLDDGDQQVAIHARTTSGDSFYMIDAAGQAAFRVADNDSAGLAVELQQTSISRAGNGFVNLVLSAEPTADVVVTLTPSDGQFTINDRSVGRAETLTFTPETWSVPQTVNLRAVDDAAVEDLTTSTLEFATVSGDTRFDGLAVDSLTVVISDDDQPTATLEFVNDGEEQGRPGRFRIRLSDPTASSAGASGLVVKYEVTAVELDSSLSYGSSVGDRLDKVAQTPTSTSGSVRVAPGQSASDVLVVPIDDFLADKKNKAITVKLTAGDGYALGDDDSSTSATIEIINDDVAGILVMTSGERILVNEKGDTATFQLALLSEPTASVTVTIAEKVASGKSRQLGSSSTSFSTTATFSRSNWYVPQQISVRSFDDYKIEDGTGATEFTGIHAARLGYSFSSSDTDYNTASHSSDSSHFTNFVQDVDVLDYELADTTATSMQSSLTTLQEGIDSLALPMVGSLTGKTGQGLRKFITDLTNSIRQVDTPTPKKLSKLITGEIASALGVSESLVTVNLSMKDASGSNPAVVVNFSFADEYDVFSVPLAADFGLPGLGFQSEGSFDAVFSYSAGLELVFPRSGDIYLNTEADKTFIQANFNAGLSDDFRLTGGLGFMQLDAVNQPSVNDNVQIGDEPADTQLDVSFELTVDGGVGEDGELTLTELTSSSLDLEEVFQYSLSGNAAMSFGVTTSVNGSAAIPSFKFELSALLPLFDYSNQEETDDEENATSFYFDDIRLDLGSYITDMLTPIVDGLDGILKPLYPLVDALYADTKIFDTVGLASVFDVDKDGDTSTIDLSRWFAGFYATIDQAKGEKLAASVEETVEFLDMLKGVMDLVRDLERLGDDDTFYVSFGSYELEAWSAGDDDSDPADEDVDANAENLADDTKDQADAGGKNEDDKSNDVFADIMEQLDELGFTIPLLEDPANAVKLLLGQDVSLFEWRMPGMGASSEIDKTFPIYGGIEGVIEGGYEVEAHLGFGFDTYGLSQWRDDGFAARDSWKVFNGFYVADLDEDGDDIPEFTMDAGMGAGLGYSARVVRADITGGLEAAARLDLLDEGEIAGTSDGKIRGFEITSRISNPLNLFELSGELIAYVKSRVQIGVDLGFYSIWKTVWERRLAEITIFEFGIGGRYGSGSVSNGHLAGSTVFFDANFNGRIDSMEPVTTSDAEGRYALDVDLRTFDTNRNGRIDADEGQLVVFGGTDTSMDQPLALPFVGPLGGMVTPLTTLHNLAVRAGVPAAEVRAFIGEVFELGDFDYLTQDPLKILQEAGSFAEPAARQAVNAYLAHIKLHFALDLISGALQNLLPDDVPSDLGSELELLRGFAGSFRERPTAETVKESLGRALAEAWQRVNPDSDPRVGDLAARAAEMAAAAGVEMAARLDQMRDAALAGGVSPATLLAAINGLKQQAFRLYRGALDGISEGLYRISDPDELVRTVAERLEAIHGDFLSNGRVEVPAGFTVTDTTSRTGSQQLRKLGPGDLILENPNSHTGGVVVEAGRLVVQQALALGTGLVDVRQGTALVIAPAVGEVVAGSLVVEDGGFVDLGAGRMRISTGASEAGIAALLQAGQGDGSWTAATGLGSSAVAAGVAAGTPHRIGWLANIDGSFTVAFTIAGDTNLDGAVDILDVGAALAAGAFMGGPNATWAGGDFNYDGTSDILDMADFMAVALADGEGFASPRFSAAQPDTPAAQAGAVAEPVVARSATASAFASFAVSLEQPVSSRGRKRTFAQPRAPAMPRTLN